MAAERRRASHSRDTCGLSMQEHRQTPTSKPGSPARATSPARLRETQPRRLPAHPHPSRIAGIRICT